MSSSKVWPYSIAIAIFAVIVASIVTVKISINAPVHESDLYMIDYHDADKRANEILSNSIEFNKRYSLKYETENFTKNGTILKYIILDKMGNVVQNAKITVHLTRPQTHAMDREISDFTLVDGAYVSSPLTLEEDGRWDIIAKVSVDEYERFLSIKTSTQAKMIEEF